LVAQAKTRQIHSEGAKISLEMPLQGVHQRQVGAPAVEQNHVPALSGYLEMKLLPVYFNKQSNNPLKSIKTESIALIKHYTVLLITMCIFVISVTVFRGKPGFCRDGFIFPQNLDGNQNPIIPAHIILFFR
jgi:hypothetical protein